MNSNFHTHTKLCKHAVGEMREYVESAISAGLKTLGFSDHSPYVFSGGYASTFRMELSQTEGYAKSVLDLKREYKKDIDVYLGFEMEYYPRYFDKTVEFLMGFSPDYFLLGQHFTKNEHDGVCSFSKTLDRQDVLDYVEQTIEGLKTGLFSYLAHPDCISNISDEEFYCEQLRRLCLSAKELSVPIEFNFLGFTANRSYPSKRLFKIVSECENSVIFGIDAHSPKSISICGQTEEQADKFLSEFNIKRTENIKLLNGLIV